jgi:hypothetical protein
MSSNIMLRHRVVKLIRRYLEDVQGFVEVRDTNFDASSISLFMFYFVCRVLDNVCMLF